MGTEQNKIESLYHAALEKGSDAERSEFLDVACPDDPAMRARIDALLRANEEAGEFLRIRPPFHGTPLTWSSEERLGTLIGPYKLLEKIGEGGMAVVYMAEQELPIRRKVALKIIKLGMDTKQVIARFEAERQALAMMDHPSIAKVLDAGATDTGRPYFVMELVQGVSITTYCDQRNLNTKERLVLFVQVCHAVQHAHQKGIIHRDIKPSNVMVTQHDGLPVPKIIDFGIAKAINQRLTEKTLFTRYAHIIGTPAYMSPEQAELSEFDIDTRSDIYSLGVLLYELLTGTTPFSEEELRKAGYIEMTRIIREQEPPRPSTRITQMLAKSDNRRKFSTLHSQLSTDLDWIVMKTLEKARDRRYDNASALALDVQRHLDDEPILARAPSTMYRLRKFLKRHCSQTVAALAIAVVIGGITVLLLKWNRDQLLSAETESIRYRHILGEIRVSHGEGQYQAALEQVNSILDNRHVGPEASLWLDLILATVREKVATFNDKIEADPKAANNYLRRAQLYHTLGDSNKACLDMTSYRTLLGAPADLVFGTPTNLGPPVNTSFDEGLPCISSDGLSLYFTSGRPGGSSARGEIWVAKRASTEHEWGAAENLGSTVNSRFLESFPSISADNLTLYFTSDRPNGLSNSKGRGDLNLWQTTRPTVDDQWGPPKILDSPINTPYAEETSCVSPDGLELYFSSCRSGNADLYVSKRATLDDKWSELVHLGVPNTAHSEHSPSLSADGLTLFLQSSRPGGFGDWDLYMTTRTTKDADWSSPVNLGHPINTHYSEIRPSISFDGHTLYFSNHRMSGFPPGGMGGNDIWKVEILPIRDVNKSPDTPNTLKQSSDRKEG